MRSRAPLIILLAIVATLLPPSRLWAVDSPYDVGGRSQLFVDQLLVRRAERVWFTQHEGEKHPANPLVKVDQPWEGWRVKIAGSVIYDAEEKLFKMWYLAVPGDDHSYFESKYVICYATSSDGIVWQKPLVGTLPSQNGRPHNAVLVCKTVSVMKDGNDPDPSRRYKMINRDNKFMTYVSPDGLKWTRLSAKPIAPPPGDVITGYWDESRKLYVAFPKTQAEGQGRERRLFSTITSKDFIHWTDPVLSWCPDLRDDAGSLARLEEVRPMLDRPDDPEVMHTTFYGIGAYGAESCTIGFPWIYTANSHGRWTGQDGAMEVQLAASRDLIHWERPFRTSVIPREGGDAWDSGMHSTSSSAFRFGDEIRLYYSGGNMTHGTPALYRENFEDGTSTGRKTKYTSGVGLVTWKLDRFVSVDGPAHGGTLTTIPICFAGKRLEINATSQPGGSIVVELLDAGGRPLPGFLPSQPFSGDDLRHRVSFDGKEDVSSLAGKPVTLRFHITDASLYSFAFRE